MVKRLVASLVIAGSAALAVRSLQQRSIVLADFENDQAGDSFVTGTYAYSAGHVDPIARAHQSALRLAEFHRQSGHI